MTAPTSVSLGIMWGDGYEITGADDSFLGIIGYTREDLERGAFDWRALTPPEHLHRDAAGMRQAEQSGGFTVPYQKDFIRKDGSRVPVLLVCGYIPGAGQAWMGYVVNLATASPGPPDAAPSSLPADLVPLELVSRLVIELVRERGRMIAMLDSTPDQIWAIDRELRLLSANTAFHAMFTALTGRTIEIGDVIVAPSDAPVTTSTGWTPRYARALAGEGLRDALVVKTAAGDRHFEVQLSPIVTPTGEVVGATGVSRDVTARVAMEAAQRAAAARTQQQERLASLGTLAGGIAHDFNNLLGIILGFADHAVADPSYADEALASIRTASLRARDLVQQILMFGQRREYTAKPVDLVALVAETGKLLRGAFRPSLAIQLNLSSAPLVILGDAAAFQQVIVNLATNAEHALRERADGVLTISVERVGDKAHLRVTDNGPGIPEALRGRVFEPFFTTKPAGEGTGLGLSVVHGIIAAHHGELSLISDGHGTRFDIAFPIIEGTQMASAPATTGPPQQARRILLCEDEQLLGNILARGLRLAGHEVQVVRTATEALDILATEATLDLMVTDLTMPGVTGTELLRLVTQRRPDLPVLVMSGNAGARDRVLIEEGRYAFLAKPFVHRELVAAINALLARART